MRGHESSLDTQFLEIAAESRNRLTGIARAYGGVHSEDLLQEILLQIWRGLPSLKQREFAATWCYRLALNTAISWKRNQASSKAFPIDTAALENTVSDRTEPPRAELIDRFLGTLGDVDRAILLMVLEDIDYAVIAQVMGLSEGAIRVRVHRIKKKLAEWEPLDS